MGVWAALRRRSTWSALGPHGIGNRWSSAGTSGHGGRKKPQATTPSRPQPRPLTSGREDPDACRTGCPRDGSYQEIHFLAVASAPSDGQVAGATHPTSCGAGVAPYVPALRTRPVRLTRARSGLGRRRSDAASALLWARRRGPSPLLVGGGQAAGRSAGSGATLGGVGRTRPSRSGSGRAGCDLAWSSCWPGWLRGPLSR
jgi:hypothetical protein